MTSKSRTSSAAPASSGRSPAVDVAPIGLDDYARTQRPSPGQCEKWFLDHPAVMAEVIAGLDKHPLGVIHRWLKQVHQFPFSDGALRAFHDRHGTT